MQNISIQKANHCYMQINKTNDKTFITKSSQHYTKNMYVCMHLCAYTRVFIYPTPVLEKKVSWWKGLKILADAHHGQILLHLKDEQVYLAVVPWSHSSGSSLSKPSSRSPSLTLTSLDKHYPDAVWHTWSLSGALFAAGRGECLSLLQRISFFHKIYGFSISH